MIMKKIFFSLIFAFCLQLSFCHEVRYLTPPNIDKSNIGKKIICSRPIRKNNPRFELEDFRNKTLVHNYGHGGSGWSIGPASVDYCYQLFSKKNSNFDKNAPIAIIGGGCIGLFTAHKLVGEGFTNITLYASSYEDLASHHAGGLVSIRSMDNNDEINKLICSMAVESYSFYRLISEKKHPDFTSGASVLTTYFENRKVSELEAFVGTVMLPPKEVIVDFRNGVTFNMVAYDDSIFVDTELMMHHLRNKLRGKVSFKTTDIKQFESLSETTVFNCTGAGAGSLANDSEMTPVQGHLIMLTNQDPVNLQYMMIVDWDVGVTSSGKKITRSIDFFPKRILGSPSQNVGVLGGSFIEDCSQSTKNEEEFEKLLDRAYKFYFQGVVP